MIPSPSPGSARGSPGGIPRPASRYPHKFPSIEKSHGLLRGAPATPKSPISRAATLILCTRAMAAMRPPATLMGFRTFRGSSPLMNSLGFVGRSMRHRPSAWSPGTRPPRFASSCWPDADGTRFPGCGVRVYPSGAKVYLMQTRSGGKSRRVTLTRRGVLSADHARHEAAQVIALTPSVRPTGSGPSVHRGSVVPPLRTRAEQ